MATIQISVREAFAWFGEKAKEFALSPIPDKERCSIAIKRLTAIRDEKQREYHEALKIQVSIQDPEDVNAGSLPSRRRRLVLVNTKGEQWGGEYQTASKKRQGELKALMEAADLEVTKLESEISSLEEQLKMAQETTAARKFSYDKADSELQKMKQLAPILIEQADALKERQKEKMEALQAASEGPDTDADEILAKLQAAVDEAKTGDRAATIITDEEQAVDLDEVLAKEEAAAASSERMARWMKK